MSATGLPVAAPPDERPSPRRQFLQLDTTPSGEALAASQNTKNVCKPGQQGPIEVGGPARTHDSDPARSKPDALLTANISDAVEDSSRTSSDRSIKAKGDDCRENGNETDIEDEDGEADDSPVTADGEGAPSALCARSPPRTSMYPYPATEMHHPYPPSSAEVLLSSATSSSSLDTSEVEDGDERRPPRRRRSLAWPGSPLGPNHRPGAVPPRARRIGALGISVHSDSDPENPNISGLDSFDRRVEHTGDTTSDTRATDLGLSSGDLRQLGGAMAARRESQSKTVAETTFRAVVDELAEQNRLMRERLKRYEAGRVPQELKRNRLFEIRFFDGLPADRRAELEEFLGAYVQNLTYTNEYASDDAMHIGPGRGLGRPSIPRHLLEDPTLTGPSNSGFEPFSASGTGQGVKAPPSQPIAVTLQSRPSTHVPITLPAEQAKALEVVRALEQLFEHSLLKAEHPSAVIDSHSKNSFSNVAYFANLLSKDFLSRGFVYLNLALTMAHVYRFNVTIGFIQRAIAQFSTRLELSPDGSRVRWTAASPRLDMSAHAALADAIIVANGSTTDAAVQAAQSQLPLVSRLSSQTEAESRSTSGSGSGTGSSTRQPSNILAQSVAQSATTAPTSVPSSGRASQQKGPPRLRRPTAAVLQPMHYFRSEENPAWSSTRRPSAPAVLDFVHGYRNGVAPMLSPAVEETSSTGSVGQVLSATNLRAHDRLQAGSSSDRISPERDSQERSSLQPQGVATGPLVFYKTTGFCTDLTQEPQPVSPPLVPISLARIKEQEHPVLGIAPPAEAPSASGSSSFASIDVEMTPGPGASLAISLGQTRSDQSASDSHASSLRRMQASGMTDVVPSDFFTLVVKTRQVAKRPAPDPTPESADSFASPSYAGFPFFPVEAKRPRLARQTSSREVVSLQEVRHQPKSIPRLAYPVDRRISDSSEEVLSPEDWSYGQMLTRSNLSKHRQEPEPRWLQHRPLHVPPDLSATPSPPHDDYLISLAAPSHAWAPIESGFHSTGQSGSSAEEVVLRKHRTAFHRLQPSTANGSLSTGDERPISLDDTVGIRRF